MKFIIHGFTQRVAAFRAIRALEGGGKFEVIIRKVLSKRSLAQNRLYWKWLNVACQEMHDLTGLTYKEAGFHNDFKEGFGVKKPFRRMNGELDFYPISTTKYTMKDFSDYLRRIEVIFAEKGIELPHPDDYNLAMGIK